MFNAPTQTITNTSQTAGTTTLISTSTDLPIRPGGATGGPLPPGAAGVTGGGPATNAPTFNTTQSSELTLHGPRNPFGHVENAEEVRRDPRTGEIDAAHGFGFDPSIMRYESRGLHFRTGRPVYLDRKYNLLRYAYQRVPGRDHVLSGVVEFDEGPVWEEGGGEGVIGNYGGAYGGGGAVARSPGYGVDGAMASHRQVAGRMMGEQTGATATPTGGRF